MRLHWLHRSVRRDCQQCGRRTKRHWTKTAHFTHGYTQRLVVVDLSVTPTESQWHQHLPQRSVQNESLKRGYVTSSPSFLESSAWSPTWQMNRPHPKRHQPDTCRPLKTGNNGCGHHGRASRRPTLAMQWWWWWVTVARVPRSDEAEMHLVDDRIVQVTTIWLWRDGG